MQPLLLENNIISVFYENVNKNPNGLALVYKDKSYTYGEIDDITERIANNLKSYGVNRKDMVGIHMEKSDNYVLTILSILKCGCTYLPIDKKYPKKRIEAMLDICKASWVVMDNSSPLLESKELKCSRIDINELLIDNTTPDISYECVINPEDLAYIIFTSGSTGEPKGMGIKHSSVLNLVNAMNENIGTKKKIQQVGLLAPMVFDMSVAQMYYALLNGKTLVIIPDDIKVNPEELLGYIECNRIDICDITPQHLRVVIKYLKNVKRKMILPKVIISSGEKLSFDVATDYLSIKGNEENAILNSYGPSEACVYVSFYLVTKESLESTKQIYIGKAIFNTEIYILNEEGSICKVDEVGELCISGIGLANGYINNSKLSSELFISNPFKEGETIYRTKDLAKLSPSGDIICLGRMDNQVKVRGYRIELEEIEYQLNQIDEVEQSKVIVNRDNDREILVAYYVSKKEIPNSNLYSFLQERLPEYMLPAFYICVDKFETNINGKIDIKRFPSITNKCDMPKNSEHKNRTLDIFESNILKICEKIVGINNVALDDNFFNIGGDSLLVMILCIEIYELWNVKLNFNDIYKCSTIYDISLVVKSHINYRLTNNYYNENTQIFKNKVKVSEFQKVVFKLEKKENKKRDKFKLHTFPAYNIVHYIKINKKLDLNRLKNAIENETMKQCALRTTFVRDENEIYMKLHDKCEDYFELIESELDLSVENVKRYLKEFTINELPLFKFFVFQNGNEQIFLFNVHHAIFDFYSIHIFLRDILNIYNGENIIHNTMNFHQRLYWHEENKNEEHVEFWKKYFKGREKTAILPSDLLEKDLRIGKEDLFNDISFGIGGNQFENIRIFCKKYKVSEFIFFTSVLSLVLNKHTGLCDISIGTYIPGRTCDDTNVIGLFTKMIGIRIIFDSNSTYSEYVSSVNNNFKEILNNQSLHYLDFYRMLDYEDLIKGELFSVIFNYVYQVTVKSGDLIAVADEIGEEPEQLPLGIKAVQSNNEIIFKLKYASRLYSKEYIKTICNDIADYANVLLEYSESNIPISSILNKGTEYDSKD